jgi:DNA-binding NarL/FixJ family response regulator
VSGHVRASAPNGPNGPTAPDPIRILVVDDQELIRAGLVMLLDSQPDFEVVAEAGSGIEAVTLTRALRPDVILMDIRMPGMDGIEATRRVIAETAVSPRVVILTTYDLDEYVYEALQAGACGFLLKHAKPEEVLLGVRAAADGGALLSPAVTVRLLAEFTARRPAPPAPPNSLSTLTPREREVFDLAVRGRSNAEIAAALHVADTTAKTHLAHAMDKLGLANRVAAVVFAYETGLVRPGETG